MPSSQADWDAKHKLAADAAPASPASIVRELLPLLPSGAALDVACGAGRNTLFLAARGQHVTAVDWSGVALEALEKRARDLDIPVQHITRLSKSNSHARRGIEVMQADLEQIQLPEEAFDLILCTFYLQRSLFPQMTHALRPGGVLLLETFTRAQLEFAGGPRNPDHLLESGELRTAFPALHMLFYRELRAGQGIASLLAQKPGRSR
jgi:tellurite methyltransferase